MSDQKLSGLKIAVLATDGFEQSELGKPREALREAGAEVEIVAPSAKPIQGMEHHEKGRTVEVDRVLSNADASSYDALVLPGGVANPDSLRTDDAAVQFV